MRILVLGAGRMGFGAAFDLIHNSPDVTHVTIADSAEGVAASAAAAVGGGRITPAVLDAADTNAAEELMRGHDSVISCVNYWYNARLSKAAIAAKANFCDLGGNNDVVAEQLALDSEAKAAGINIIPDCGLAPGMVSVLAMHGANRFDSVDEIHIRVGGLPQQPKPPLDYQIVFSVEGLINEYIEPARIIRGGVITQVESMTELESLSFEGFPRLEAFQTSGGTSTLPDTFLGKVNDLDYKTIRFAGHCEKFKTMIDLGLCSSEPVSAGETAIKPRALFAELLSQNLPADEPDVVLVRLEFSGVKDGSPKKLRYDIIDEHDRTTGLSAMMRTTAFPASIIAQMMARGEVTTHGATPQETAINPDKFVAELTRRNIRLTVSEI